MNAFAKYGDKILTAATALAALASTQAAALHISAVGSAWVAFAGAAAATIHTIIYPNVAQLPK